MTCHYLGEAQLLRQLRYVGVQLRGIPPQQVGEHATYPRHLIRTGTQQPAQRIMPAGVGTTAAAAQAAVDTTDDVFGLSPDTAYMVATAGKLQKCMCTCNPNVCRWQISSKNKTPTIQLLVYRIDRAGQQQDMLT
jgi:hypothetical protein